MIKRSLIIKPLALPMVCQPLIWSDISWGGFLENNLIGEDIVTGSSKHDHKMAKKRNNCIKLLII